MAGRCRPKGGFLQVRVFQKASHIYTTHIAWIWQNAAPAAKKRPAGLRAVQGIALWALSRYNGSVADKQPGQAARHRGKTDV